LTAGGCSSLTPCPVGDSGFGMLFERFIAMALCVWGSGLPGRVLVMGQVCSVVKWGMFPRPLGDRPRRRGRRSLPLMPYKRQREGGILERKILDFSVAPTALSPSVSASKCSGFQRFNLLLYGHLAETDFSAFCNGLFYSVCWHLLILPEKSCSQCFQRHDPSVSTRNISLKRNM
jgi:hypothetical protein